VCDQKGLAAHDTAGRRARLLVGMVLVGSKQR